MGELFFYFKYVNKRIIIYLLNFFLAFFVLLNDRTAKINRKLLVEERGVGSAKDPGSRFEARSARGAVAICVSALTTRLYAPHLFHLTKLQIIFLFFILFP